MTKLRSEKLWVSCVPWRHSEKLLYKMAHLENPFCPLPPLQFALKLNNPRQSGFKLVENRCIRETLLGANEQGQQDREPLRGKSASERVSERKAFQRFSEIFRGPQRPLTGRFPSQRLSPVAPNRFAP